MLVNDPTRIVMKGRELLLESIVNFGRLCAPSGIVQCWRRTPTWLNSRYNFIAGRFQAHAVRSMKRETSRQASSEKGQRQRCGDGSNKKDAWSRLCRCLC